MIPAVAAMCFIASAACIGCRLDQKRVTQDTGAPTMDGDLCGRLTAMLRRAAARICTEPDHFFMTSTSGDIHFCRATCKGDRAIGPTERVYLVLGGGFYGILECSVREDRLENIVFVEGIPHHNTGRVCKIPILEFSSSRGE